MRTVGEGQAAGAPIRIAVVLFPGITPLDLVGPVEVLRRIPEATFTYVAASESDVVVGDAFRITPDVTFEEAPTCDVVLVPGGEGVAGAMLDSNLKSFLVRTAVEARVIASVCTGSLVLASAGLLRGRRATTHWVSMDQLSVLGAQAVRERVVVDGPIVTGAGVSSGIDLGLCIVKLLVGTDMALLIQLAIEYDPEPLLDLGVVRRKRPELVEEAAKRLAPVLAERRRVIDALGLAASVEEIEGRPPLA